MTVLRVLNSILPSSSVDSWRELVTSNWPLRLRHAPFTRLGSDTFLTVSPGGIILNTADAELIAQITSRGMDFPKPIHIYSLISIYGQNVVSSEGITWRHHRKMTSPAFSEKNNQLVWKETLDLSRTMVASWVGTGKSNTTSQVAPDAMRLSLEIIGRAGLGQRLDWGEGDHPQALPMDHTMSFSSSFQFVALNILELVMLKALPSRLARILPIPFVQKLFEAYDNWGQYLVEMIGSRKRRIRDSTQRSAGDLIGQLLQSDPDGKRAPLSDSEIMGNIFAFIVAGHETSASSLAHDNHAPRSPPRSPKRAAGRPRSDFEWKTTYRMELRKGLPKAGGFYAGGCLARGVEIDLSNSDHPKDGMCSATTSPYPRTTSGLTCQYDDTIMHSLSLCEPQLLALGSSKQSSKSYLPPRKS